MAITYDQLMLEGLSPHGLIQRVAQHGYDGDYEYKTSVDVFLRHLQASPLEIEHVAKVWPFSGSLALTTGGNYVFTLRPR